jgi:hypothetical protein
MPDDLSLRLQALSLALNLNVCVGDKTDAETYLKNASKIYAFLTSNPLSEEAATDKKPRGRPKKSESFADTQAEGSESESEAPTKEEPAVTFDTLKKAVLDLALAKTRDVPAAVLAKFGAKRITDLTEDKYAEVYAAVKAAGE